MRKYLVVFAICFYSFISNAQNVGIGVPNPQNKLHVGGGFRLDTLTGVGGAGLVRHDANGVVYGIKFSGNTSDVLRGDGSFGTYSVNGNIGWLLNGNSGTNPATNFLGTTDDQPLVFKVNNVRHGYLGNSIFIGKNAGIGNTIPGNLGIGELTLEKNTSGAINIAIGDYALWNNTQGYYNLALGYLSLGANTTGNTNTAVGNWALSSNTTSSNNTAIGFQALQSNTIGLDNTAIGYNALSRNVGGLDPLFGIPYDGIQNTAVGSRALYSNTKGSRNSAFGTNALNLSEIVNDNSAFGAFALEKNTQGFYNNAFGSGALKINANGNRNSAFGTDALASNIGGYENTAIGHLSLRSNNSYYNSALGARSLISNASGHDNTALGYAAMEKNTTTSFNTAVGAFSLYNNNQDKNTAVGYKALELNNQGASNTAVGVGALLGNVNGNFNSAFGVDALRNNSHTDGTYNAAFGLYSLRSNVSGRGNTAVGSFAGAALPNNVSNTTTIGYDVGWPTTLSNHINIGNFSVQWIGGQTGWFHYSDKRIKNDIKDDVPGLSFITRLKPITYHVDIDKQEEIANSGKIETNSELIKPVKKDWEEKYDVERIKMTGFFAQDVEEAAKSINYSFNGVHNPKNGGLLSLDYSAFVVPLVKAVQEQQKIIDDQNKKIEKQQQEIDLLIKEMQSLKKDLITQKN